MGLTPALTLTVLLTSLGLSFFTCLMGLVAGPTLKVVVRRIGIEIGRVLPWLINGCCGPGYVSHT